MKKSFDDTLSEVWIIDAPIVLLYCICRSFNYPVKAIVVQRIENILDINIISAILKSHDINIISNISINHPRYSLSSKEIKSYSLQVSSLLTSLRYSKLVVRCGSGFLHYVPPFVSVTVISHGFGDLRKLYYAQNKVKQLVFLLYNSIFYALNGWHQLRCSYYFTLVSSRKTFSSPPFVDLNMLRHSEYFQNLLTPLKDRINAFRRLANSRVILCLPSLKSSDLKNVYTESSEKVILEEQLKLFLEYANDRTLMVIKYHPAISNQEAKNFNLMLTKSNINFIDVNELPKCNHAYLPVEILMYVLEFDLLLSPGTAAVINKPENLKAHIVPSSFPDTKFQDAFRHLTMEFQLMTGDYSATIC